MGGRRADELRALIAGAGFKGISVRPTVKPAGEKVLTTVPISGSYRNWWKLTALMRSNGSSSFLSSFLRSPPLARLWTSPSFGCLLLKKIRARFFLR